MDLRFDKKIFPLPAVSAEALSAFKIKSTIIAISVLQMGTSALAGVVCIFGKKASPCLSNTDE